MPRMSVGQYIPVVARQYDLPAALVADIVQETGLARARPAVAQTL